MDDGKSTTDARLAGAGLIAHFLLKCMEDLGYLPSNYRHSAAFDLIWFEDAQGDKLSVEIERPSNVYIFYGSIKIFIGTFCDPELKKKLRATVKGAYRKPRVERRRCRNVPYDCKNSR